MATMDTVLVIVSFIGFFATDGVEAAVSHGSLRYTIIVFGFEIISNNRVKLILVLWEKGGTNKQQNHQNNDLEDGLA